MKKLMATVVAVLCSILFLPIAHAAAFDEYLDFAIASYDQESKNFSMTIELLKDMKVGNNTFAFEYTTVNSDGSTHGYYDSSFVYMGGTSLDEDPDGDIGDHIVGSFQVPDGVNSFILHVNLDEYKGDLVFNLNDFVKDPSAKYPASYPNTDSVLEQSPGLGNDVETIFVDITEDNSLDPSFLEKAIQEKTYAYAASYTEGDLSYMWVFDGTQMEHSNYNLNLGLNIGSSKHDKLISSLIPTSKDTPLFLEFAHHGELPKGTGIMIHVGDFYNANDKLSLYYFNPNTEKLEPVETEIFYEEGYVGFELEHCSEYVLVKENAAPNNAQTSSMNVLLYAGVAVVSLAGIIAILVSFRKKAEMR